MAINIIWSILAQGEDYDPITMSRKASFRLFLPTTKYLDTLNILVPYKDQYLRSFQVEQVTKLIFRSVLRDRAAAYDPVNSYEKSTLAFPEPGDFHSDLPTGVRIKFLTSQDTLAEVGQVIYNCTVDPVGGTFTTAAGVRTFTVTNNLSSVITIENGFKLRLQGDLGVVPFSFDIWYVANPQVNWPGILAALSRETHVWMDDELKKTYDEDPFWINKIAAVALHAVENSHRWPDLEIPNA
jgi:hypothetical protein